MNQVNLIDYGLMLVLILRRFAVAQGGCYLFIATTIHIAHMVTLGCLLGGLVQNS